MRKNKLIKQIENAIKNEYLYSDEELRYMKTQLNELKFLIKDLDKKNYKGFGKYE
jgi:Txe/YoeB family toxin of Txe-Axe toxin-antitoxin module